MRSDPTLPLGRPLGRVAGVCCLRLWVAAVACSALAGGCPRLTRRAPPAPPPGPATAVDAVLRPAIQTSQADGEVQYRGPGWALRVPEDSGWRRTGDSAATLALSRDADGVHLHLALEAYPVRDDMPIERFLAAYAMWMIDQNGPRVEYAYDDGRQRWKGYAIHGDRETYYAFDAAGDRAYVLRESAVDGVLSRAAVDEFEAIVAGFHSEPAPSTQPPE